MQLESELQEDIFQALDSRRPILTHVNADTTWLVQLPYPVAHASPAGRSFFNILIDPWLSGPQSDVASWFSTQWHVIPSSIKDIAEMEERLREMEDLVQERPWRHRAAASKQSLGASSSHIDAVVVSHEFTDHCHKATLMEIDPSVPVWANDNAARLIKSFNHFKHVTVMPSFRPQDTDWRKTSLAPLPEWLGVSRITSPGNALYYHSAVLIVAALDSADGEAGEGAEAILYSPHGITAKDLEHVAQAEPRLRTLALLHGLHDVGLGTRFQMNLGAYNGLKAERLTRPKYWVASHDEPKKGGGFVSFFLRREVITLQQAIAREREETSLGTDIRSLPEVNFSELRSGESLLLL